MNRVVVTGLGAACCAGKNIGEFFNSLISPDYDNFTGNSRIKLDIDVLAGEADAECFTEPADRTFDSPTARLCLTAAKECVDDYRMNGGKSTPDGLVTGTSTGGQYVSETFLFSVLDNKPPPVINFKAQGLMTSATRTIAGELGIEGRVSTVSTACTSSANAIAIGASLIERGVCKCVIAGGGDALCATTLSGFHILQLTGPCLCRPFGRDRPGMTIGEGAGFLMLEALNEVTGSRRNYHAELLGYGMGSDAYHMTAPDETGQGAIQVMQSALHKAGIEAEAVNFVTAHGTGTKLNDASEAAAIRALFGDIPVSSLKALVGHTLGGAGALNAIASIYSIINKTAWENFNSYTPGDDCDINLVCRKGVNLQNNPVILSNSFAFGGNNCTLIFGRPEE